MWVSDEPLCMHTDGILKRRRLSTSIDADGLNSLFPSETSGPSLWPKDPPILLQGCGLQTPSCLLVWMNSRNDNSKPLWGLIMTKSPSLSGAR
jgi:hypothetical protein